MLKPQERSKADVEISVRGLSAFAERLCACVCVKSLA